MSIYEIEWVASGIARIEAGSRQDALDIVNDKTVADMVELSGSLCTGPDIERCIEKLWYVNVYLVDRAYGGPEEGGWWYETGSLVRSDPCLDQTAAEMVKLNQQAWCDDENKQRRSDIGSVLSEGKYVVYIEDEPGKNYPETKPIYE